MESSGKLRFWWRKLAEVLLTMHVDFEFEIEDGEIVADVVVE